MQPNIMRIFLLRDSPNNTPGDWKMMKNTGRSEMHQKWTVFNGFKQGHSRNVNIVVLACNEVAILQAAPKIPQIYSFKQPWKINMEHNHGGLEDPF